MDDARKPVLMIDIDGVIVIGRNPTRTHWATDLQQHFGFDKAALQQHFFSNFWADIVTGKDTLLPRLAEALQTMRSDAKAEDVRDFWFANDAQVDHDMLGWINARRAAGYRICLATNQDHSRTRYLMDTLDLRSHCDGIYHSAALGVTKSDQAFFDHITQEENLPASNFILIDDTAKNVTVARAAGWQGIHYTRQPLDQLTTAIVSGDAGSANPSTTSK